jgi:hypothetical protein
MPREACWGRSLLWQGARIKEQAVREKERGEC